MGRPRSAPVLAISYAAAVFLGAFLLFLVQPMFGRMVLPLLGGSPAVWTACMLFFQVALLGGYLYAHLVSRLDARRQAFLHLLLLVGAALALPLTGAGAAPEGGGAPVPWLLGRMLVTVGPPFLVLAATGPLLQRWFSRSGHPDAQDPYWLYAASNAGSLLALFAYPVLVEPRLGLAEQGALWAKGYGALAVLIAGCAAAAWRAFAAPVPAAPAERSGPRVAARERATWVALAFFPSSLFLGVTTYLTTDLAPVPLLWVLPLAVYLLSFVLVFARRPLLPHRWILAVQPALVAAVALWLLGGAVRWPAVAVPVHLAALFATAMVCHGELARRRPPARRLTEFYLWVAVGGALGGLFNAVVAPALFSWTWEYPLVLALACLARPWPRLPQPLRARLWGALRTAGFVFALLLLVRGDVRALPPLLYVPVAAGTLALFSVALGRSPAGLAVCVGAVLLVRTVREVQAADVLLAERSFFGHYRVTRTAGDGGYHVLTHGSTLHGAQSLAPARRSEPLTYYVANGPLGDIFASLGVGTQARRVAVVGLGTGTAAAYGAEGEAWTFYEIDPGIESAARNPRFFTYLRDSPADVRVVLGDARLSLAQAPGDTYDLILLDAFSSDAVPVHLLTREALGVYLSRLAPGGRVAFHVSNRYLDLEPVIAALARERGLAARARTGPPPSGRPYRQSSTWVVVTRRQPELGPLLRYRGWRPARTRAGLEPWTDDHASVLSVFAW